MRIYTYSSGQRPNGVLDPEQQILSAGAKNSLSSRLRMSVKECPKGTPRTEKGSPRSDQGVQGHSKPRPRPIRPRTPGDPPHIRKAVGRDGTKRTLGLSPYTLEKSERIAMISSILAFII